MRKSRKQGIYPAPVYVATFANGEIGRMSFYSPLGKPFDFDYGRRVLCGAWGHPITLPSYDAIYPPRTDLIAGYVEHNGERFADPQFEPASEVAAKTKRDPLLRLVASIDKLDWADLERIQAAIDARLLATELPKAA